MDNNTNNIYRPNIPKYSHPVYTGEYSIVTQAIEDAINTVKRILDNRISGGIIYGPPRTGKTRSIEVISREINKEFDGSLPIFIHGMTEHSASENTFYRGLLMDLGYGNYSKGTALDKRDRIIALLANRATSSGTKKVLLFIDEANCMVEKDFYWLMDIHNRLERVGIHLTTILVGTHELLERKEAFLVANQAQIVGRFMVYEHEFHGIRDAKALQRCLGAYDNSSFYPTIPTGVLLVISSLKQ